MLIKVKDGMPVRMIHEGGRYHFSAGEIKDCPASMLSAFRNVLVSAEPKPQQSEPARIIKMPIINISSEASPVKIPVDVPKPAKTKKVSKKRKKKKIVKIIKAITEEVKWNSESY